MKMIRSLRNRLARPFSEMLLNIIKSAPGAREKIIELQLRMLFGKREVTQYVHNNEAACSGSVEA